MADRVGQQFGNYRLLRILGRGSFAEVYLGEHQYLERPAAIKVLHVEMESDTHEAFQHEARIIARLQHPHIVRVYDFGLEGQTPYLAMEYTPNGSLRTRHPRGLRLSLEQIVAYVKQIASALDYAHEQQVIHRDVKPANLLLNAKNEVVLSDFGLAIVERTLESFSEQHMAGSPLYMAPEQIQHKPCPASDQYALGVMVYEWLIGEPPFYGSAMAVLGQHLYHEPPGLRARLPELRPAVEDAVFGTLAKNPRQRFASVTDFATALEEACFATQPLFMSSSMRRVPQQMDGPTLPLPVRAPRVQTPLKALRPLSLLTAEQPEHDQAPQPARTAAAMTLNQAPAKLFIPVMAQTNRHRLLRKVRSIWISGVLSHSLHGAALIALGLQEQPDAVADPWRLMLQHTETAPCSLAGTRITEAYDEACGELLILGAPGAGKTTLLLELARDLLARAEADESHPLPVIFNLSSWAIKQQPLQDWLSEELTARYQVPRKLARRLLEADQILPLLDGLDEVDPTARTTCIEVINAFRQEHGLLPLIVCSRSADYLSQTTRILLRSAVTIQALTPQQVDAYLASGQGALQTLRIAWHHDLTLRELTSTPLMLSLMTLTYQGMPLTELMRDGSLAERQRQVFEHYVARMLQRSDLSHGRYSSRQTVQRLSWLAQQLAQRNQTVFYIEHMQPDWLPSRFLRWLYAALAVRSVDALIGLLVGILGSFLVTGNVHGVGVQIYAPIGLMIGLFTRRRSSVDALTGSPAQSWLKYVRIGPLLTGLITTPLAAFFCQGVTSLHELEKSACLGASIGLVIGILLYLRSTSIQPVEIVSWSWYRFIRMQHLYNGLLVGLSVGLLNWWFYPPVYALIYALFWFAGGWLVSGLLSGFSNERLDDRQRIVPNQGIQHSARNGRRLGFLAGLCSGLIFALAIKLIDDYFKLGTFSSVYAISYGAVSALGVGLLSWLFSGGDAAIKHRILCCFLWIAGPIPWNFARFLDHATECILLRRVGGGYIFTHRLLLDYFASLAKASAHKQ